MEIPINKSGLLHLNLTVFMLFQMQLSSGSDSIFPGQTLSGNHTLTSKSGIFEMGLFSPGNSHNYYLGIWYKGLPLPHKTVVWVANREYPVSDPHSSVLEFNEAGNLVLLSPSGFTVWSTNLTSGMSPPNSTVAVLGNDGNLIVKKISDSLNINVSWQSFDHLTDTWLPGAKLRSDSNGTSTVLTSWKDQNDPTPGPFSAVFIVEWDPGYPYLELRNDSFRYWDVYANDLSGTIISYAYKYTYITYHAARHRQSDLIRYVLDVTGEFKLLRWKKEHQRWDLIWKKPSGECGSCGNFSICVDGCPCIPGFRPTIPYPLCERISPLQCNIDTKDTFSLLSRTSHPPGAEFFEVKDSAECQLTCLRSCLCSAYAYNGTCLIWEEPLQSLTIASYDEIEGDIYVRVAASQTLKSAKKKEKNGNNREPWIIVGAVAALFSLPGIYIILKIMRPKVPIDSFESAGDTLTQFKYQDLWRATKKFTEKLGQGGFSTVYKGALPNATFIAVKELRGLMQNEKQLRAELSTIGVIQHRNLVRLLGFSLKGSKRFLVYDHMPNGSLESHLFHKGSSILDWGTRYSIAIGTAKGLAYLHEECRDCIMHFDIKPENILLDVDYTPKVADFGLAKLLCRNSSRVLTTMRGTRGYLAPEWFAGEPVTAKVDVYSYGMVLFEIISGRRNMDTADNELSNYFPALVLNALNNGEEVLTLVDHQLEGKVNAEELGRACKVACWCIQDKEKDRPTMMQVVRILEGTIDVNIPPIPRFFQSLAEGHTKAVDVKESEDYSSSTSSLPASFSFPSLVHPTENKL